MTQRIEILSKVVELTRGLYDQGDASLSLEVVNDAEIELLDAKLQLAVTAPERIALRESQLALAKQMEELVQMRQQSGDGSSTEMLRATANRLNAEIDLLKEKQR